MEKFRNKYRIPSARLQSWDYRNNGAYFITICTKNRNHFFGHVKNGKMQLTEIGKLAEKFWMEIPKHFPFVELGNFVIMPNHMPGILIIDKSNYNPIDEKSNEKNIVDEKNIPVQTLQCKVSSGKLNPESGNLDENKNEIMANISPKSGSISTIIRSYKSLVTKNARKINHFFAWQTRFHDQIIRDNRAFKIISNYIENNPKKWEEDNFNSN